MKKLLAILVLCIVMFNITWCTKPQTNNADEKSNLIWVESNESSDITKNECMNGCEMMWKTNDGNKWKSSSDMAVDCNNLCDATQGMQNNDTSSCEKSEWILKDTCYSDIAKNTKDVGICENVSEKIFKNTCYSSVAEAKKDISICEKIDEKMFKDVCLSNIAK